MVYLSDVIRNRCPRLSVVFVPRALGYPRR